MKKLIYLFLALSIVACTDGNKILGPCYVSLNQEIICTEEYKPVWACNNLVYYNSCESEKAGNLNYKSTTKDSGEKCSY